MIISSCEEPIDFDFDEDAHLVVTSHFSQNKALIVYVSESKTVTSQKAVSYVENASISVFSGNEFIELMEFVYDDSRPYYYTQVLNPKVGELYTIKVNVPGHEVVTAANSIPIPVPIEGFSFLPIIGNDSDNNTIIDFNITVSIQDPIEYDNYYHLFFYQELTPYTLEQSGDTVFSNFNIQTKMEISLSDPDFNAEKNYDDFSFLIEDTNINGELVEIPFKGRYSFNPSLYVPGDFIVELRTVSKEYFNYYISVNSQANGNGGDLNDVTVLYDNIVNGEGIFVGYSSSTRSYKLQN